MSFKICLPDFKSTDGRAKSVCRCSMRVDEAQVATEARISMMQESCVECLLISAASADKVTTIRYFNVNTPDGELL